MEAGSRCGCRTLNTGGRAMQPVLVCVLGGVGLLLGGVLHSSGSWMDVGAVVVLQYLGWGDELGANAFVKALRVLGGGRGDIMPCSILCASGVEAHAAAEWQFPLVAVAHCCSCRCVPLWWLLLLRLWG